MSERVIFNVVGEPASGKGFICRRLARLGCTLITPSSIIRTYAESRHIQLHGRSDYAATHARMTAEDPLAMIRPLFKLHGDVVTEGYRAVNELRLIGEYASSVVIAAVCDDDQTRFDRAMDNYAARGSRDATTLAAFLSEAAAEQYNPDSSRPSVRSTMAMADYRIDTLAMNEARVIEAVDAIYALTD